MQPRYSANMCGSPISAEEDDRKRRLSEMEDQARKWKLKKERETRAKLAAMEKQARMWKAKKEREKNFQYDEDRRFQEQAEAAIAVLTGEGKQSNVFIPPKILAPAYEPPVFFET